MKTKKAYMPVGRRKVTGTRRVYSDTCRKLAYSSRKEAAAAAAVQRRMTGETIEAYRCTRGCHAHHLGHPPGTKPER